MTFKPDNTLGNFLPEQIDLPNTNNLDQFREELKTTLEDHSRIINRKDTGQYEEREVQVNQTFPGATLQQKRSIFRKFINLGTLVTGVNNIAHNIPTGGAGSTFVFTRIYGTIYDQAAPLWVPIPNDTIFMSVDATNVNVTIPVAYNGFDGIAVLEFYKN